MYIVRKTTYVANARTTLAVISNQGTVVPVSKKLPDQVQAPKGWVILKGFVNNEGNRNGIVKTVK